MTQLERDIIDAIRGVLHVHSEYNADPAVDEIAFVNMILDRWERYGAEEGLGHGYSILRLVRLAKESRCQQ